MIRNDFRWWDWSDAEIDANAELLIYPDRFFERFGDKISGIAVTLAYMEKTLPVSRQM
ncbi:MAG: hypothetical protein LBL26_10605 [Peptococcaceae bacterium]|jgi:hypothetical protein|nr:hypothetical protein [Peptococcaceae bacterium]